MQFKKIVIYSFCALSIGALSKQAQAGLLENDIYYEDQPPSRGDIYYDDQPVSYQKTEPIYQLPVVIQVQEKEPEKTTESK